MLENLTKGSQDAGPIRLRKNVGGCKVFDLDYGPGVLSVTILQPGAMTRGHRHRWPEAYIRNWGEGSLEIDGIKQRMPLSIIVPANSFHRIINTSEDSLVVYCAWAKEGGGV